jgi:MFS family permease
VLTPVSYGIFAGYVQTALPWLLRQSGYSVDRIGSVVALILSPMAFYFIFSPLLDFGIRRRTWMLVTSALAGASLAAAIALLGSHLLLAQWLLLAGFTMSELSSSSGGALIAITQVGERKGRAGAWLQGGALASQAAGGALLLYFAKHLTVPTLAFAAALLVLAPAAVALTIPEPREASSLKNLAGTCLTMGREIRATFFSMKSLPGILLLLSPVGTGAAQSLFAAMSRDYQVGANGVMLVNGMLGAVLNLAGASMAIIAPAQWDRRIAYAGAGLASALSGIFLACAPITPLSYYMGVTAYIFTAGACWGFFLGVVMITMGEAGMSAGSRYCILVSLGNLPIVYMTMIESRGYALFGIRGVPAADALGNLLVVAAVGWWMIFGKRNRSAVPSGKAAASECSATFPVVPAAMEPAGIE